MNRLARMAVLTLALLCAFTIGAGAAVARLLPPRLALFQMPAGLRQGPGGAGRGLAGGQGRRPAGTAAAGHRGRGQRQDLRADRLAISVRTSARWSPTWRPGRFCTRQNAAAGFTPASTTKIATAVAAIEHARRRRPGSPRRCAARGRQGRGRRGRPGPGHRAGRRRRPGACRQARIRLADYPQPATLPRWPRRRPRRCAPRASTAVRLRYDASLFGGPAQAPGWPPSARRQLRVERQHDAHHRAGGRPGQADRQRHARGRRRSRQLRPRSLTPSQDAAAGFAPSCARTGSRCTARRRGPAGGGATLLAAVHSPPLARSCSRC